jgi:hypothetical protein
MKFDPLFNINLDPQPVAEGLFLRLNKGQICSIIVAGRFVNQPTPKIDVWIDLRDIRSSNRYVYTPEGIEYIAFPFRDGELIEAKEFDLVLLLLGYLGEKEDSFTKLLKK